MFMHERYTKIIAADSTDNLCADVDRWIVQKFGGTSVGKFIENIAEQVVP